MNADDKAQYELRIGQWTQTLNHFSSKLLPEPVDDNALKQAGHEFLAAYDATWKLARKILKLYGEHVHLPLTVMRHAYAEGWLKDRNVWERMIADRNTLLERVPPYQEMIEMYRRMPDYLKQMQATQKKFLDAVESAYAKVL